MSTTTSGGGLGRSAAIMAAGTATSRALGLLRVVVLTAAIGSTTVAANAFAAAYWLPSAIYMLIAGGVLNAVLVPQIIKADRTERGHEFVDRLLSVSIVLLLGATAVLMLAAPLVVLLAVGGPGDERDPRFFSLTLAFALWSLPQVLFYGVYTLLGQVLNARGIFGPYMWAPVVNNLVAIAGIGVFMAMYGGFDPDGPVTGYDFWTAGPVAVLAGLATLGVAAQAFVLVIPLRRSGFRFRPRMGWRGVGLGSAARVAGWTFAALVVGQVGVWVVTRVSSGAAQADPTAVVAGNNHYTIAFTIFMLPHSLVTVSLVTAMYTRLAGHAAAGDVPGVRRDYARGLRVVGVFTVLATAVLVVLALPVARIILIRDQPEAARVLAPVVVALALGLVALGVWSLTQRVYYAYEDARSLFWLQVPMALVVAGGTYLASLVLPLTWWTAAAGVAIAASYVLGAARGAFAVRRRLDGIGTGVVRTHVRAGAAAAGAAVVGWPLSLLFGDLATAGLARAVVACVVVGTVMLLVYVVLLRVLGVEELQEAAQPVLRRVPSRFDPALRRVGLRRSMGASASAAAPPAHPPAAAAGAWHGGDRLETATPGEGTLVAGRYRLVAPSATDLPGVTSWSGEDQVLDRAVRVLLLREGRVRQAQDAARRAALVSDPRLLRVLDVGDHEDVAYVVTAVPDGRGLDELVATGGPLPADQARAIVGEAASALEAARRRGVHHMALRPSAVRVREDGSVLVDGLGADGELAGHGLGDARSTSRADTVSLVALLYLALTGHWPAPARSTPSTPWTSSTVPAAPVVDDRPVPPADLATVPNDLDTLCSVTLGPHDDGPHSPAELVEDLAPWGSVDAAELLSRRPTPRWEPLSTASASAGGAAAAAAAGALAGSAPGEEDVAAPEAPTEDAASDEDRPDEEPMSTDETTTGTVTAGAPQEDGGAEVAEVAEGSVVATAEPVEDADGSGPADRAVASDPDDAPGTADDAADDSTGSVTSAVPAAPVARTSVRESLADQEPAARPAGTPPPAIPPGQRVPRPAITPAGLPNPSGVSMATPAGPPPAMAESPVWPGGALGLGAAAASPGATGHAAAAAPRPTADAPTAPPPQVRPARTGRPAAPVVPSREEVDVLVDRGKEVLSGRVSFDPTPWVLTLFLAAVVLGVVMAWNRLSEPLPPIGGTDGFGDIQTEERAEDPLETEEPAPPAAEEPEPEAEEPAAPPVIAGAQQIDPPPTGDNNEHPEAVDRALDGDPGTFWFSRTYASPTYGMKPGIGYAVTLAEPAMVSEVRLWTNSNGGMIEVRATDPSTPTEGEVLASGPVSAETVFTFEEPVLAEHVVLWIPELPQVADGRNRIELTMIEVS